LTAVAASPARALPDRRVLLLAPAVLLAALVMLPFLPQSVAADTAIRLFVVLFLIIAAIDFLTLKVPNVIVYPALLFAFAATAIVDTGLLPQAAYGFGANLGIMMLIALIGRGAMGMGDVKVASFSGIVLGLKGGIMSILFGFTLAGAVALPVVLLRLRSRKDVLPLAPFLAGGALVYAYFFHFLLEAAT
jgi:leader peptidase (prepilin peptidase)/N-methyltransferase